MTETATRIRTLFQALIADEGIPADFLVEESGTTIDGAGWTRQSIDLPDGTELRAWNDDTDIVVQIVDGGSELSRLRLSNVTDAIVLGVLAAIVTESLKD